MKLINPEELAELIIEFKSGNTSKFQEIYNLTWRHVYFAIVRRVGEGEDMKDLLQEVYFQIYKSLHKLEEEKTFLAWADRLIQHKYIDQVRRNKKHLLSAQYDEKLKTLVEDDKDFMPEEKAIQNEEHAELHKIIESLPKAQKQSIIMFYFQNMSTSQIAEKLGVQESVIRKRLFDARKTIKEKSEKLSRQYKNKYSLYSLAGTPILLQILVDQLINSSTIASLVGEEVLESVTNFGTHAITATLATGGVVSSSKGFFATAFTNVSNVISPVVSTLSKVVLTKSIAVGLVVTTVGVGGIGAAIIERNKKLSEASLQAEVIDVAPIRVDKFETPQSSETIIIEQTEKPKEIIKEDVSNIITEKDHTNKYEKSQLPALEKTEVPITTIDEKIVNINNADSQPVTQNVAEPTATSNQSEPKGVVKTTEALENSPEETPFLPPIILNAEKHYDSRADITVSNFIKDIYFIVGNSFDIETANAKDFASDIDFSKAGDYVTTINAISKSEPLRDIIVKVSVSIGDITPPVITTEFNEITIKVGERLTKEILIDTAQIKVVDNMDTNLYPIFLDFEKINSTQQGEYVVFVSSKDLSGNESKLISILIKVE